MRKVSLFFLILCIAGLGKLMAQQAQPTCNTVDELQDDIYAYDWGKDLWLPFTADSLSSNLLGITLDIQSTGLLTCSFYSLLRIPSLWIRK